MYMYMCRFSLTKTNKGVSSKFEGGLALHDHTGGLGASDYCTCIINCDIVIHVQVQIYRHPSVYVHVHVCTCIPDLYSL